MGAGCASSEASSHLVTSDVKTSAQKFGAKTKRMRTKQGRPCFARIQSSSTSGGDLEIDNGPELRHWKKVIF